MLIISTEIILVANFKEITKHYENRRIKRKSPQ